MPGNDIAAQSRAAAALSVRPDGKGKIWSHIRQAWFAEFPEEVVRQAFVCRLVNDYGYVLEQMAEEIETSHGRNAVEADIVIWRTARDKADEKPPLIVTECKADNVAVTPKDYSQGESYARNVNAPFFVTHNNRELLRWNL
jgi:type I restriction enzyme M protein